ncbi:MAG: hypothetical protein ACHP65_07070 [Legionellales bacterium]
MVKKYNASKNEQIKDTVLGLDEPTQQKFSELSRMCKSHIFHDLKFFKPSPVDVVGRFNGITQQIISSKLPFELQIGLLANLLQQYQMHMKKNEITSTSPSP